MKKPTLGRYPVRSDGANLIVRHIAAHEAEMHGHLCLGDQHEECDESLGSLTRTSAVLVVCGGVL